MAEEVESSFNNITSNSQGFSDAPALKVRLDSTNIIESIEMFLKGERIVVYRDEETGEHFQKRKILSEPKANAEGIHSIINRVSSVINSQVVQGNFTPEQYSNYVYEVHISLLRMIIVNMYEWSIDEDDVEELINFIMDLVQPFASRMVGNKERESYTGTITHTESQSTAQPTKKSWFGT